MSLAPLITHSDDPKIIGGLASGPLACHTLDALVYMCYNIDIFETNAELTARLKCCIDYPCTIVVGFTELWQLDNFLL